MTRAWCGECRTMAEVEDVHDEGTMTRAGEETYTVTDLACGHHVEGPTHVTAPAPGAPYAGDTFTRAANHHPRALRAADAAAARRAADVQDPWA